jgi:anti-sigma factor RsiW
VSAASRPVTENDLHGYADGLLPPDRRAEVDAHLAATPDDAARVAAWRQMNEDLHAAFDGELERAVPQAWTTPPQPTAWQKFRVWQTTRTAAAIAAALLVCVGGAGGWLARNSMQTTQATAAVTPIAYYAARAHETYAQEVRHAVEVPADQEDHLVRWLSNRMGAPVKVPQLTAIGYKLMGGRLLPSGHTLAAQFMYEDASGARLTLYVKSGMTGDQESKFRYQDNDGVLVCFWSEGAFGYALAGRVPKENLWKVAQSVYNQVAAQ